MNMQTKQLKGFTIIEVVLVLAIAALIFLMVFIALPALQANQRDTARKADASTVAAAVQSFQSTERESVSVGDDTGLHKYIDKLDQYDKSDVTIVNTLPNNTEFPVGEDDVDTIRVFVKNKCDGTKAASGNTRTAAVVIVLEQGSGEIPHCVDV